MIAIIDCFIISYGMLIIIDERISHLGVKYFVNLGKLFITVNHEISLLVDTSSLTIIIHYKFALIH